MHYISLITAGYTCDKVLGLNMTSTTKVKVEKRIHTVLPAKSDSDIMFCLQIIRDLESIDHVCINPIHRIGLIHKLSIDRICSN